MTLSRGSIQLRHRKGCKAKGKDSRVCRCGPTGYAVLGGRWERVGYLPEGWRKADLSGFEHRLAEMREASATGQPLRRNEMPQLDDYAEGWFDDLYRAAEARQIAKATHDRYESYWTHHIRPAFGHVPVGAIDRTAIRRFRDEKLACGLKANTVNGCLTALSAMLTDAIEAGLIDSNPVCHPRRARHGGTRNAIYARVDGSGPKHLEPIEARALLSATAPEHRAMVLTALTTGCRRAEVRGLRWEHVLFARNRILVAGQRLPTGEYERCKHGSEREVVLCSRLSAELGKRRLAEGYLFTIEGKPFTDWQQRSLLDDALERAGLTGRGSWHRLRHTYSSVLENAGIPPSLIGQLLGHSPRGVTAMYTHPLAEAFEAVGQALDLAFGVNETSMDCRVTTETHETQETH